MKLSEELTARGFIYQFSSDTLEEILDREPRTVYLGIDPTADAIHVGNLVPFMLLNHFMRAGHKVILLLGGGTALIGDPSGRDTERELVSVEQIQSQCAAMEVSVRALRTGDITFVNNYDWLSKLTALDFMRDVGKHFTVNAMVKKDSVATRMESEYGISFTEFSYSLLQAYDYYHLHVTFGADLQIGGSDQWGNLIAGVELIRRTKGATAYALTMPLVVDKATGKKFGKSMGNAVWLSAHKTTPYQLYQFWLNTSDESVVDYLKLFTLLSLEEIAIIEDVHRQDMAARTAQKRLATEVVRFVHGEESVVVAQKITNVLFGDVSVFEVDSAVLSAVKVQAPRIAVADGAPIIELLIESGLATSKREAREFITAGAVSINGLKVTDVATIIRHDMMHCGLAILARGKKSRVFIEIM